MSAASPGYTTEIGYTHFYSRELAPAALSLAVLHRGVLTRTAEPLRYLELGYGQGLALNIHAAACPGEFWGTDINPLHVANARAMAAEAGSGARILDDSLADLLARQDLPEFDVIALEGVWSWISTAHRAAIVEIVRRKLADGGLLYLSYNCLPGWSALLPLRHLMALHADLAAAAGEGILERTDAALDFAQRVVDTGIGYFQSNPAAVERLNAIRTRNRVYVAHEYFSGDWEPMPFSQVARLLAPAGTSFAVSANLMHHVDGISLSPASRKLLSEIDHPILRESVRDYLINAQFRKDIFVKGVTPMARAEQEKRFLAQRFVLLHQADQFPLRAAGPHGTITLKEDYYRPLIEALAENDFAPKTLTELSTHARLRHRTLPGLITALVILTGANYVRPAQDARAVEHAAPRCKALNAYLVTRLPAADDITHLASPVTGDGVALHGYEQLFLMARQAGRAMPEELARYAWGILQVQQQASGKDGNAADMRAPSVAALTAEAKAFTSRRLPLLQALQVA